MDRSRASLNTARGRPVAGGRRNRPRGLAIFRGFLVLFGVAALGTGCASTDHNGAADASTDPLASVPADFQLDVRVLVGSKIVDQERLERRPAHMVVLPDGSLHAAQGNQIVPGSRPGLARVLYRDQVADVWALLTRLAFVGAGEPPAGPVQPPEADEIVYVVEYTMNSKRRRVEKRVPADGSKEGAATVLVRSLGALAWLRDAPITDSTVAPLRYDYGPDPWARYRSVDSAQ